MAKATGTKVRAALHPALLSSPRSDRAMLGPHASVHDPQSRLQNLRQIPRGDPDLSQSDNSQEMGAFSRPNQRQLPRHITGQFSDCRLAGEYQLTWRKSFLKPAAMSVAPWRRMRGLPRASW